MKKISFILIVIVLFFNACANSDSVSKEECKAQGLEYKKEKVLNFRTGEYEIRSYCK